MLATIKNAYAYQLQAGNNAEMLNGNDRADGVEHLRAHGLGKRPSFLSRRGKPSPGTGITSVSGTGWRESCQTDRTAMPRAQRLAGALPAAAWATLAITRRGPVPAGQEPTVVRVPRDLAG